MREWFGKHVNTRPVWRVGDLPTPELRHFLTSQGYAVEVHRVLVLGRPGEAPRERLIAHLWDLVVAILEPYAPWALSDHAAMLRHLGDVSVPLEIGVSTARSRAQIDLGGVSTLALRREPELFDDASRIEPVETATGKVFSLETAESLLVRVPLRALREHLELLSSFLKSASFDLELLARLAAIAPRASMYRKLADMLDEVGRPRVAAILSSHQRRRVSRSPLPSSLAQPSSPAERPHVTRLRDQLRRYADVLAAELQSVPSADLELDRVLDSAIRQKKHDTYHSSTIEGYRLSPEEIQALLDGDPLADGTEPVEIERRMALRGYLDAHNHVVETIRRDYRSGRPITEALIRDAYAHLFVPSVEAGILTREQLVDYRQSPVFLRGSRYVPPSSQKVADLMRCLVDVLVEVDHFAVHAALVHYGFVTVHPYQDGNGRTARLLMNYALCTAGAPWVTIRVEHRDRYFRALGRAQCDSDITPFAELLRVYFSDRTLFVDAP